MVAFGGSLKDVPVVKLGALVLKEVMKKAGLRPVVSKEVHGLCARKVKRTGLDCFGKKGPGLGCFSYSGAC